MQRLLHGRLQRNTAIGRFGEIAGRKPRCRKRLWIQASQLALRLQDQIDRLRRQRVPADVAPLVNKVEDWSGLDLRVRNPLLQDLDRIGR